MIKFALNCSNGHEFESWFQSGSAFEGQAEAGLIACPHCAATAVRKAIMAPALAGLGRGRTEAEEPAPKEGTASVALLDEQDRELRALVQGLRKRILEQADDVGLRFPEEARKMHEGEIAERPIHGRASFEEARALIEEGIGILPIPLLTDEFN